VVNTAARIQAGAPVNAVLAGQQTYRATSSAIEYREAEPIVAKGKNEPVAVWEALQTTEKVGRVRRCMLAPYAFEGISTWLQPLDRFAQVVERTKGDG